MNNAGQRFNWEVSEWFSTEFFSTPRCSCLKLIPHRYPGATSPSLFVSLHPAGIYWWPKQTDGRIWVWLIQEPGASFSSVLCSLSLGVCCGHSLAFPVQSPRPGRLTPKSTVQFSQPQKLLFHEACFFFFFRSVICLSKLLWKACMQMSHHAVLAIATSRPLTYHQDLNLIVSFSPNKSSTTIHYKKNIQYSLKLKG